MPITPFPPAPSRADPATFADKADAYLAHLQSPFVAEANALQTNVNAKEAAVNASATAAAASELAAANTANVAAWVSGTTYAVGVNRYDTTDFLTYRRKNAGAGTTRPGLDPTNWKLLTGLGDISSLSLAAPTGAALVGYIAPGMGTIESSLQMKLGEMRSLFDWLSPVQRSDVMARTALIDCTEAINAALMECAGKFKLEVPAGRYLISNELKAPSDTYVVGAGVSATEFVKASTSPANQCGFTNTQNTRTDANTGNANIILKDFTITGALGTASGTVGEGTSGCGIGLAFVQNAVIERVESRRWSKHCFDIGAKYYWTPSNPNPTTYVSGPSSNIVLRDVIGTESGDDIITTHFSGPISIENPHCYGSETVGGINLNRNGIEIDDGSFDVTVTGGLVVNCNSGIEIKGHDYAPAATRIKVYGTTIRGCSRCINLRHMGFYGPTFSATAKDVLIDGVTVYAPQGYASGPLLPRAIRVASYDNVRVVGLTVIGTDETLGGTIAPEDEETSSPVYIHQGARNVVFDGLAVRNYAAATESIVRVTGTGRGTVKVLNSTFEECGAVPVVLVSGSLPGIIVDGLTATRSGAPIAAAVEFTYQPEDFGCEVRNIATTGYTNAGKLGGFGAQFDPGMNAGRVSRWVVADSIGGTVSGPQAVMEIGWSEGVQDLGVGKGVKYSYKFKLNGNSTIYEGAYSASYKTDPGETHTGTALVLASRATGDAGAGATARWAVWDVGHMLPMVDVTYDVGSAAQRVRHAYIADATLSIPTYASNAAAITGGLAVGRVYQTASGELRIRV